MVAGCSRHSAERRLLSLAIVWFAVGPIPAAVLAGLAAAGAIAALDSAPAARRSAFTRSAWHKGRTMASWEPRSLCAKNRRRSPRRTVRLLAANEAYRLRFDAVPPLKLPADEESNQSLLTAVSMAWRDGAGCVAGVATLAGITAVEVQRAGLRNDMLLWRYPSPPSADPLALAVQGISGVTGERLTRAGRARGFGRQRGAGSRRQQIVRRSRDCRRAE